MKKRNREEFESETLKERLLKIAKSRKTSNRDKINALKVLLSHSDISTSGTDEQIKSLKDALGLGGEDDL